MAEARRLGGLHRRKKRTLATIYGFAGLRSIEDGQALLETITIETLAPENSIARNRAINSIVATGAKLIELGDLAERVAATEVATKVRRSEDDDVFPATAIAMLLIAAGCSSDGTQLVSVPPPAQHGLLVMADAQNGTIFTVRDDATSKELLPATGRTPSWTPDGRIIYVSTSVNPDQIIIMDANGGNPQQIGKLAFTFLYEPQLARNGLISFGTRVPSTSCRRTARACGSWHSQPVSPRSRYRGTG